MEDSIDFMFDIMGDYRLGKASTLFNTIAQDLGHIVLTNKKAAPTRFIRSAGRATKTFLQNLPTLVMVLSTTLQELIQENKNTKAKQIQRKLRKLRDPRFLLRLVGLAQIMESYIEVSLEGQYTSHLPCQVWDSINKNRSQLDEWGRLGWAWGEKDLKYIDAEAPKKIVERLEATGMYQPKVYYRNVMRRGAEMREAGLLEGPAKVLHLFDEDVMVKPLAGEIPMEVPRTRRRRRCQMTASSDEEEGEEEEEHEGRQLTKEDVKEVEDLLTEVCKSIVKEWHLRMVQSPLDKAACEVLGRAPAMEESMDVRIAQAQDNLRLLLSKMPLAWRERFEVADLLDGYITYLDTFRRLEEDFSVADIYIQWRRLYVDVDNPGESSIQFADFFECLQVTSYADSALLSPCTCTCTCPCTCTWPGTCGAWCSPPPPPPPLPTGCGTSPSPCPPSSPPSSSSRPPPSPSPPSPATWAASPTSPPFSSPTTPSPGSPPPSPSSPPSATAMSPTTCSSSSPTSPPSPTSATSSPPVTGSQSSPPPCPPASPPWTSGPTRWPPCPPCPSPWRGWTWGPT